MKQKKDILKSLVPVVAVVVLAESVMLILSLNSKTAKTSTSNNLLQQKVTPSAMVTKTAGEPVYRVAISTTTKEMKLNKAGVVEVKVVGNVDKSLDSISVYLKYDPNAFEISGLTFDKKLLTPTFSKVSQAKGLIVATFLISDPGGLKVKQGEELTLMKFNAKPVKTGNFGFEISTGNEMKESVTMFVESATSKILPFSSDKLTVNVSR
jgi:hypothetical protein